jgi:hypothetical protein
MQKSLYNSAEPSYKYVNICKSFCNPFLHKGLDDDLGKKKIRNYFIFVENFVCVFALSMNGRLGATEAHFKTMEFILEPCRLSLKPWKLTLELCSPWSSGAYPGALELTIEQWRLSLGGQGGSLC